MKLTLIFLLLFSSGGYGQRLDTLISSTIVPDTFHYEWLGHDSLRLYSDDVSYTIVHPKKKHSRHWFPGMESTKGYEAASNTMDSIFSHTDLTVKGKDVQLGGPLPMDTTALLPRGLFDTPTGVLGKGLTLSRTPSVTIDSMYGDTVFYTGGYKRDLWLPETLYQWWKKGLWVLLGFAIGAIATFLFTKNLF